MRNIFFYILIALLASSCHKMSPRDYITPLDVPEDFDWKSIEAKKVTLVQTSSVLNEDGDTIASFLPPGSYDLTVGKGDNLNVVKENVSVQTKAMEGNIKQKIYFPAKDKYATVMFEDLFPYKGDMDMNDIVFGLNIVYFLDNQARLLGIQINIQPRAIGSSVQDIGLAANLSSNNYLNIVKSISHSGEPALAPLFEVTYNKTLYSPELNSKSSQVIPLTGNLRSYFKNNTEKFINVRNIDKVISTENFSVTIELLSNQIFPISSLTFLQPASLGRINLDIFAVFGNRGKEIHYKGQTPTDQFANQYFLITWPKYDFSTIDNWVWMVICDQSILYPQEFNKIYNAYPNFKVWAESGGASAPEWYKPSVAELLYTKATN